MITVRMRQAAKDERQIHRYKNRTGNLERSTKAKLEGDVVEVGATALSKQGIGYHSFVERRGFSRFSDIVRDAEQDLNEEFDSIDGERFAWL